MKVSYHTLRTAAPSLSDMMKMEVPPRLGLKLARAIRIINDHLKDAAAVNDGLVDKFVERDAQTGDLKADGEGNLVITDKKALALALDELNATEVDVDLPVIYIHEIPETLPLKLSHYAALEFLIQDNTSDA